jgi:transposase InsO family protein
LREFSDYLKEKGIRHERTTPYSPMQNGITERMNRTLQERITAMLQYAGLKLGFWAEALNTAVYILNLSPSKTINL